MLRCGARSRDAAGGVADASASPPGRSAGVPGRRGRLPAGHEDEPAGRRRGRRERKRPGSLEVVRASKGRPRSSSARRIKHSPSSRRPRATDCHRDGARQRAPSATGRLATWPGYNPDHASQNDVFLRAPWTARLPGRRRSIGRCLPRRSRGRNDERAQSSTDTLACVLPGADCATGSGERRLLTSVRQAGVSPVDCAAIEWRLVGATQAVICSRSASATISAARLGSPRASRCAFWASGGRGAVERDELAVDDGIARWETIVVGVT